MALGLSLTAVLLMLAGGAGVTGLIRGWSYNSIPTLFGLSVMFGMGIVSLALWTLGLTFSGVGLISVVALVCTATFVVALFVNPIGVSMASLARLSMRKVSFAIVLTLAVGWLGADSTLGFDGLFNWEFKGCLGFLAGGSPALATYPEPTLRFAHPDYPLLIPLSETWLYSWIQSCNQQFAKLIMVLSSLAGLAFIYSGIGLLRQETWRALLGLAIVAVTPILWLYDGGALSGYADFPLAVCYLGSVTFLLAYLRTQSPRDLWTAATLAALLPWIKQEGAILWACQTAFLSLAALKASQMWTAGLVWLPGATLLAGWRVFLHFVKAPQLDDFMPLTLQTFMDNWTRVPIIAVWTLREMLVWPFWGLLWPVWGVFMILPGSAFRKAERAVLLASVGLPLSIYAALFIFSAWDPFTHHLNSAMPRLLVHLSLVAAMGISVSATPTLGPLSMMRAVMRRHEFD